MANSIVLLSETVIRLEAQFWLLFLRANEDNVSTCGNMVVIFDSIQTNKGLCLVSSMIILLQLTSVHLLCHQH